MTEKTPENFRTPINRVTKIIKRMTKKRKKAVRIESGYY